MDSLTEKVLLNAAKKILPPGWVIVPEKPEAVQRWPFVEKPGEFTARFAGALGHDVPSEAHSPGLAAMRQVLIETPPALSPEYLSLLKA